MAIDTGRPLSYKKFKEIYATVNKLSVEVVLESDEGVLLTLRAFEPYVGKWHLPGGAVNFRETLENAVLRIAKEELNIDVKVDKFLGYIEYPSILKVSYDWPVSLAFKCSPARGGQEIVLDMQASAFKYFKKIPKNTLPEHKEFVEKFILG